MGKAVTAEEVAVQVDQAFDDLPGATLADKLQAAVGANKWAAGVGRVAAGC